MQMQQQTCGGGATYSYNNNIYKTGGGMYYRRYDSDYERRERERIRQLIQMQMVMATMQPLVLPQNLTNNRRIELVRKSFDPLREKQAPYESIFSCEAGLNGEAYTQLIAKVDSLIEKYKNSVRTAYNCVVAGMLLIVVFPVSIPLIMAADMKFQASVSQLVHAIETLKAEVNRIALQNGAKILIGLNDADFNAKFALPGAFGKNFYFQEVNVILELPQVVVAAPMYPMAEIIERPDDLQFM